MNQIRQYFEHAIQKKINDKEWAFFVSKLSRQEFPKKQEPELLLVYIPELYIFFPF